MKLTKTKLKQIIREEIQKLNEFNISKSDEITNIIFKIKSELKHNTSPKEIFKIVKEISPNMPDKLLKGIIAGLRRK